MNTTQTLAFSALAEPTRLGIIEMLAARGELSAGEISARFKSSASAISQHLKVLREAKLVVVKKQAQQRRYQLNLAQMAELEGWLHARTVQWNGRLDSMSDYVQTIKQGVIMAEAGKFDLVVTRIVDAPVNVVWRAWTEPEHIMKWWGPQDFTSPSAKVDLREGGQYVFAMQAPDYQGGAVSYTAGVYKKIVPGERLEFTQGLSDADGKAIDPTSIGMPADFPAEIETVVEFRNIRPDMTELVITERGWAPGQMLVFSYAGMQQSIDKLGASVK